MVLPHEPEFEQALHELETSLQPFLTTNPQYKKALEIIQVPERVLQFRVTWEDDQGKPQVNRGFRVQYNSALGPYKGGLRLHPTVNLSILKFLGFEQTFKNALTGLSMGGGKGGSDFDPKGKSDNEIRRFCVAFMSELFRHIGQDTDVPAGDIGTGAREIGFLFGAYRRLKNEFTGMLTGKGINWGGSFIRPEATGYGLIYYVEHMIAHACPEYSLDRPSTLVAISGSGNVSQFTALKVIELGATVLSLSDSKGSLISEKGYTKEAIEKIAELKLKGGALEAIVDDLGAGYTYHAGKRPWTLLPQVHIALPGATQNEVSQEEAEALVKAGTRIVAEGSNMGCTEEAIAIFENSRRASRAGVWYAPGKASNCGGVAVSGLEMAQNSQRLAWSTQEVDAKLKSIMAECYQICYTAGSRWSGEKVAEGVAEGEALPSLLSGANVAGFIKVADAMKEQGDWW
ncbi:NADP-specific glutamate dehydrogenase [Agaricus bisporus var. bisporus H97]|uniref:NADP-specific glutamate dehydrogenase n=1 Tax=Agaricus bisporus var. bisporus (strain H97 / ATCC MYA-4626 / FGSC 10389) TaxID=936046 RepID=UPI00029F51DA|nr:NADP-specific glutamate dehydrogenase [Agaricus bisporus var. bisporus H97]EKV44354.1 NADP-specific glutamate dehydrogenase [Agaricus bisporus var. bisporus H97]